MIFCVVFPVGMCGQQFFGSQILPNGLTEPAINLGVTLQLIKFKYLNRHDGAGNDCFTRVCLIYRNTLTQCKINIFFLSLGKFAGLSKSTQLYFFGPTLTCSAFKFQKLYSAIYRSQAALLRADQFHPQTSKPHPATSLPLPPVRTT